ncbi:tetratricopeptide repeat protein [Guyparkeria halopsychrophila]|uniref:tetratricopeptide repeat protein n=1 Tax=Guyparkeria halopsychrophila TaxID=3139421 RepID=UPI0037C5611C
MERSNTFGAGRLARALAFSLAAGGLALPLAVQAADVPAAVAQDLYEDGGVEHWLPKAEKGDIFAQYVLGHMYSNGKMVEKDYEQGLRWYRAAAEAGFAPSQLAVGTMYFEGQGVERDRAEAIDWFTRAAEEGYARAQSNLAALYLGEKGIEPSYEKALHWYGEAAAQGHTVARYNLGMMYAHGLGLNKPDYVAAYGLLSPLVESGHRAADELMRSFLGEMNEKDLLAARELAKELRAQDRMLVALDQRATGR